MSKSIVQGGSQAGHYREGYEGYGRLFERIGASKHQSCLLVTSREKPPEVALLEGETVTTRSLHLIGLPLGAGRDILKDKGLQGAEHDWEVLITHYGGNPLALKLVAQVIREVFGGAITAFLKDGELFFRDVRDVLDQQMKRLSSLEEEIVYWLAIEREATSTLQLARAYQPPSIERGATGGSAVLTTAISDRNECDRLHSPKCDYGISDRSLGGQSMRGDQDRDTGAL